MVICKGCGNNLDIVHYDNDIARCYNCHYEQILLYNKFVSELFKLKLMDKDYIIVNSYVNNILKFSLESDFNYAKYLGGICDWKIISGYIKIDNISCFKEKFKLYCMLL